MLKLVFAEVFACQSRGNFLLGLLQRVLQLLQALGTEGQILLLVLLRDEVVLHMHVHILAVLLLLGSQLAQSLNLLPLLQPFGQ